MKIGSRKSQLAMVQSEYVQHKLQEAYPEMELTIVGMSTKGDQVLDVALSKIGEKSLFTKELEVALEQGKVDIVVHSLKDLPTELPKGMALGAILEREDPRDAVVMKKGISYTRLDELPAKSIVGTSSLRRIAQLKRHFPDLVFEDIRGNLNTRLSKLDAEDSKYCAIILAVAGLKRLGWKERISSILDSDFSMYAVGQGALAVECREEDLSILKLLKVLDHKETRLRCIAERAFMRNLEGGCSVPIGVHSEIISNQNGLEFQIKGFVCSLDGSNCVEDSISRNITEEDSANAAGNALAEKLVQKGAREILKAIRK